MKADLDQAQRFLTLLAGNEPVTFQTFDDSEAKNNNLARILHGTLEEHGATLASLNAKGAGIFVMVNRGDGQGRKAENVTCIRALFVDLDGEPLEPVLAASVAPHISIESSAGRFHAYWLVSGCTLEQFTYLQAAMAAKFNSDPKVKDLPRVMRLPGFWHQKGKPFQTRIIEEKSHASFAVVNLMEQLELNTQPTARALNCDSKNAIAGFAQGSRNDGLFRYASSLRARGMEKGEARLLVQARAAGCQPPMPENEAAMCLESAWRYDSAHTEHLPVVRITCAANIKPEPICWLWDGWLARGKLHIFAGQAGTGKTTIAIALAATVSMAGRFPDGTRAPVGNTLIWSGEDSAKDTLIPRLLAAGADMQRVHFIGDVQHGDDLRSFDPATDIRAMADAAARIGDISLLIVDPVVNAVAGDSHKNGEVRRALQPLVDFGEKLGCAVLGISHFSKGTSGRDPLERVCGSLAFGAFARIVLATAKINDGGSIKRIFCRAKNNIGVDQGGFEYDLHQKEIEGHAGLFSSYSVWGQAVEGSARELLAESEPSNDDGEVAGAEQFLRDALANGAVAQKEIERECKGAGFSLATLRRAKKRSGVVSKKDGMTGGWFWSLPDGKCEDAHEDVEDAHQNSVSAFEEF